MTWPGRLSLNSTLQALGMRNAFDGGADLSGLGPGGRVESYIGGAGSDARRNRLGRGGDVRDWHCRWFAFHTRTHIPHDRPSLSVPIRDNKTGAILFAAEVSDPAAS